MPQSLSAVYIHLIFSTKERRPWLRDKPVRDKLHAQLGGISKTLGCPALIVGGVEDHVHLLCRFGRMMTQAEWVKELKRVSNLWLKEQGSDYVDFAWQGGYADFSVSQSNLARACAPTSPAKRNIIANARFKAKSASCWQDMASNSMSATSGIEPVNLDGPTTPR